MILDLPVVASLPQVRILGWAGIFYGLVEQDESSLQVLHSGSFSTTLVSVLVYFECFEGRATRRWVGQEVESDLLQAAVPFLQMYSVGSNDGSIL